jgi:hypothetical protein
MKFRLLLAAAAAVCAFSQPQLTTIQDVLYKADGTRFNGTVTVTWTSFESADGSEIATQSTSVKVLDGNLHLQLVPTSSATPAIYYTITYNSDGKVQFQETWSVPSSAQALRVRDVRVASDASSGAVAADTEGSTGTPVTESGVVGLIADLAARPMKGPGYSAGRAAVINALGALESATGSATDCLRVDGSAGPCGSESPSFVDADALTGIVDGANTRFSLTATPSPASSLAVYRNGVLQKAGLDYPLSDATINFEAVSTPQPGDTILASYRLASSLGGTAQAYPSPQVLCSGTGGTTTAATSMSIGACLIPGGLLAAGDRVEVRLDLEHGGSAGGFTFGVMWGETTMVQRTAAAGESLVSVRGDGVIRTTGAQLSHQSWGGSLAYAAGVGSASDSYSGGLTIDFRGALALAGETLTLRGYSVIRIP